MTTQISILGNFMPDVGVYLSKLTSQMSLANVKNQLCYVMVYPTGTDLGGELSFTVPQNYSADPVIILKGAIDGTAANTFGVGLQQLQVAAAATIDAAYEAEDLANNATWTGYADEEVYQISITPTPASAYVAGNTVFVKIFRDNSVDDTTWDFLLTDILFQYTEA
jgi:hypothetical protein